MPPPVTKKGRILLLTEGGVTDPLASSGSNHNLYRVLSKHYEVLVADVRLRGWQRYTNALYALSICPRRFRSAYYVNRWAFEQKTKMCEQALKQHCGQYDLIFQIYATYAPTRSMSPKPYVLYEDCTHRMLELECPTLETFRPGQRQRWYELETRLYQQAAYVFAPSQKMSRILADFYQVAPAKIAQVGAGINFTQWPQESRSYDGHTILFVGKDFERKGGPCLLEAFELVRRQVPDARLIIVGPTKPIEQDGVLFMGRLSNREHLQQLYTKATLFVMPSIFEPWGHVFTEAMAHKLPCVGTNVGGIPDIIVDGETGYLVPPNQPEILAERMLQLLRNPHLLRQMGEQGYQRAMQEFTWEKVVERMRPHLECLIRGHLAQDTGYC